MAGFMIWLSAPLLIGQETDGASAPVQDETLQDTLITAADLFEDLHPLEITLALNLKEFQKTRYRGEYIPVEMSYRVNDTLTINSSVRIKARGVFRRQHCQLAPFWLNTRNPEASDTLQPQVSKIKIVTHCRDNTQYDNYVLREYLTYGIYNLISPVSFRARLIRMTYVDTGRKGKETEHWAFMIEPEERMAERLGARVVKNDELSMRLMNPEEFDLVALFLYMIGNPDYSVTGRHNIKILAQEGFGTTGYTPVPYDFDYSGLVNTYYAVPPEDLGIRTIRDRYFRGLCRDDEAFRKAMDSIAVHREEINGYIHDFPYLDDKEKEDMIGYIESYFAAASNPASLVRSLKATCK